MSLRDFVPLVTGVQWASLRRFPLHIMSREPSRVSTDTQPVLSTTDDMEASRNCLRRHHPPTSLLRPSSLSVLCLRKWRHHLLILIKLKRVSIIITSLSRPSSLSVLYVVSPTYHVSRAYSTVPTDTQPVLSTTDNMEASRNCLQRCIIYSSLLC